jgi:FkbM family methyltransferase
MIKETQFEVPKIRTASKIEMGDSTCYLFEMEHPGHTEQTLMQIFDSTINSWKWDRYIKEGSTVIDIGGHVGDTTIAMQFLARGTVLGIEPNPVIKSYLDLNCHINSHLGKFVTANEAVTTQDIDAVEIMDHNNHLCNGGLIDPSWTPSLQARMRSMSTDSVTAPGMTLQHVCEKYLTSEEIAKIGFIKIDTEGHDVSIIDSSREFIDSLRPVIFMEWFFHYTAVEIENMFRVIKEMGYVAYDPVSMEIATPDKKIPDLLLIHETQLNDYL